MKELDDARKALTCLYIAVERHIAEDVQKRCEAAFTELQSRIERLMDRDCPLCSCPDGVVRETYHTLICNTCNGSGEGRTPKSRCADCRGTGEQS